MAESTECPNIKTCTFFQIFGGDPRYKSATSGFVRIYCRGEKQDLCVRKCVAKALGDPRALPANMLPNGLPLTGTEDTKWSESVKEGLDRCRHRVG